jgi:hypothetical protein
MFLKAVAIYGAIISIFFGIMMIVTNGSYFSIFCFAMALFQIWLSVSDV